ncbi:MAG: hypothetical protein ACRD12_23695 [Acidimicrobiales bacterium]
MLEVADQLIEDPRLIRIGHTAMHLLHNRVGQHLGPGEVVESNFLELPLVDGGGMCPGHGRDLVRDGQDDVEALLPDDIEVRLQLRGVELVGARLHLHEATQVRDPRLMRMSPSGKTFLSPTVNGTSMKVSTLPAGAPGGAVIDLANP